LDKNGQNEAEEIILQAISHSERRGIIRIIGANQEGVTYSSILGETGLNTGHLNYHLRSLDGLIVKSDDKLYCLSPLGFKALEMLNGLIVEIDSEAIQYVKTVKSSQDGSIHPFIKGLIYISIVGIGMVFLASLFLLIRSRSISEIFISVGMGAFTGTILWVLVNALRTVPEFVRRLERKLMND
jgi:hypothetical protein